MKSKKVTMLAAALVVAVVAAAGIGFATQYTATTTNSQNSIDSTYIKLTQDDTVGYTNNFFTDEGLIYNTENISSSVTKFSPVFGYRIDATTNKVTNTAGGTEEAPLKLDMAKVSNDLELTINTEKSGASKVTLTVTVSDFTPVTGLNYRLILTDSNDLIVWNKVVPEGSWSGDLNVTANSATANVFNVALYIECPAPISIDGSLPTNFNSAGFTNYSTNPAVTGSIFTFTVTAGSP